MTHPQFQEPEEDTGRMTFISHLGELRRRLMYVVAVLLIAALGSFSFAPELFDILRKPLENIPDASMIVLTPLEMFVTYLKLAVVAGIFLTTPWILVQLWLFIAPGLYQNERRWLAPFVILGSAFFCLGGAFSFYIVLPLGFEYLVEMVPDSVSANYSVGAYFSLVIRLLLAFGIVFELPLVMWIMAAAGIASPDFFATKRKYWIVIAVVLAAFFTPPDPFTQMLMAVPLVLFFELGILGARIVYRKRQEKTAQDT